MKEKYSPAAQNVLAYLLSHPYDRVSLLTHIPPQVKATLLGMYSRNDQPMRDTLLKTIVLVEFGLKKNSDYDALPAEGKEKTYQEYAKTLPSGLRESLKKKIIMLEMCLKNENNYDSVPEKLKEIISKKYADLLPSDEPPLYHLFDKKAAGFLEEWAIKHGHQSLKETAPVAYIVEGVSIITAKALEDDPLFHGQELSTRYKSFAKQKVQIPPTLAASPLREELEKYFTESLERYLYATHELNEYQEKAFQKPTELSLAGWKNVLTAETFDNARYYLNAGITTSLGIMEDARTLERKLRNILVFPFPETREVAHEIIEKAKIELSTLITHTQPNEYKMVTEKKLEKVLETVMVLERDDQREGSITMPESRVHLLHATPDLENRMIADILYGEGRHFYPWDHVYARVKAMTMSEKKGVLEQTFEKLGDHDEFLRQLNGTRMIFEMYPDFGAWRDIQRHRRSRQTFPLPTCDFGYDVPSLLKEAGLEQHYKEHQEKAREIFEQARKICPEEAIIIPTLGFRVKQVIDADMGEWLYIWRLRTTPKGHFSYRQLFIETFEHAKPYIPLLAEIVEKKGLITKGEFRHGRLVEEQRYEEKQKR